MEVNLIAQHLDRAFAGLPKAPTNCMVFKHGLEAYIYDPIGSNQNGIEVLDRIDGYPQDKLFTIRNRNEKEYVIWILDKCMDFREFEGAPPGKTCEAVVFNERMIAWIELKMEAHEFSVSSANNTMAKASKQLLASVKSIMERTSRSGINFPWTIFEAYIGTPAKFPRRQGTRSEFALILAEMGISLRLLNVLHLQ